MRVGCAAKKLRCVQMGRRVCAERKESADPWSGVLDLFELGEVYLPLPPPPWALFLGPGSQALGPRVEHSHGACKARSEHSHGVSIRTERADGSAGMRGA